VAGLEELHPFDFACLQADSDPELELAVLTAEGLWLVNGGARAPVVTPIALDSGDHYQRLAAGDVDGDGLDDIVVANELETLVLAAKQGALTGGMAR
jgi:hypothetical protein